MVTDVERFFTKANQHFYHLKRVIFSCETPQQLSQTLNWYTTVLNNLGRELNYITCNYSITNKVKYHIEFCQRCELLTEEVNRYVDEINNKPNKLVVRGFTF